MSHGLNLLLLSMSYGQTHCNELGGSGLVFLFPYPDTTDKNS
jgi:hypothetical protein